MGALIHLADPLSAGADASRVFYFVGRTLTASDLALQSRYIDARLLGLTPANSGVLNGLGISPNYYSSSDGTTGLTALTIGRGAAIGSDARVVSLTAPFTIVWQNLLAVIGSSGSLADGIYLLTVRTLEMDGIEGPPPYPCVMSSSDPLLDIRQDSFVEVSLSTTLGPLPTTQSTSGLALAVNTLVGQFTADMISAAVGNAVPLALLMVKNANLIFLSQAAGRLVSDPNGIAAMLVAQTREAFTNALGEAGADPSSAAWQSAMQARFRYLPGAGELPAAMLLTPDAVTATCPFLPPGMAVYLQAIRASQAQFLLQQMLARPQIDLSDNTAEAVTLSLAVPDASWTPDLLDIPQGDPVLASDTHFAYAQARAAQVTLREDWIALYGGLTAVPAQYAQETAFLINADAAAQNLSFLLTNGAIEARDLVNAANSAGTPDTFFPLVTGWIAALNAALTVASQVSTAASNAAVLAVDSGTAPTAIASAAATAAQAAATSALPSQPAPSPLATAGATAAATAAAAAAAASVAAGSQTPAAAAAAAAAAALAAATPPASIPALPPSPSAPPAPPNPGDAPHLLANLGYQIVDPEPGQADPSLAQPVPVSSDTVLAPLMPFLPPNSAFVNWSSALTATPPDPVLLQPLIAAGVVDANADPATQAAAISALIALPAPGDPANDDTQAGALMQLATLQLFYAVLGRVARAQEYSLDAHSRLIAVQRQHLDMMSTYISAFAGGVPPDGSGLSFTKIIPFFQVTPPASPNPAPAAPAAVPASVEVTAPRKYLVARVQTPVEALQSGAFLTAAKSALNFSTASANPSLVSSIGVESTILRAPVISDIGSLFGNQSDVAKTVAAETSALSQAPPFSYQAVQYGTASHIAAGPTLFQSAQTGLAGLRNLMGQSPLNLLARSATPSLNTSDEATNYGGIVASTVSLLGDIAQVENHAINIEAGYMLMRDRVQALEALVAQQNGTIASARDALRTAQVAAAQTGGDYAAAQSLVKEQIAQVEAAIQARNDAIAASTGLFLVRELQTVVVRDPLPALSLTADSPDDLAPGCTADHPGPPAALTPFLDLLLEVPLNTWQPLQGGWTDLPDSAGLQRLTALRATRLTNWTASSNFGSGAAAMDLANLAGTTRAVFDPVLRNTFTPSASLALSQQSAFAVFSAPDIVTLPANTLRIKVESLRARLESATGCLFETLITLPASARFTWATLARAGTLPALAFSQWPLAQGLGTSGTTSLRQLAGLVNWMAAQLSTGASAAGQTALGNLVCAAVIAAAYGDPDEGVTGNVVSSGGVLQSGVPVRIVLNRPPPIGTVLNLFDGNQNLAATVTVQDHDAFGTTAKVVSSFATTAANTSWTVASQGARSAWLPS